MGGKEYAITGRIVLCDAVSTAEPDQVSAVSIGGRPYVDEFRTVVIALANSGVCARAFTEKECSQRACELDDWTPGCSRACSAADVVAPRVRRRSWGIAH